MLADIFGPDLFIVVIVLIALLFAGPQIPKLARSLGASKSEFEKGLKAGAAENPPTDSSNPSTNGSPDSPSPSS